MDVKRVDPVEAKALLDAGHGYVYLDVRSKEEFSEGHVPGAVNIPIMHRGMHGMTPNRRFVEEVTAQFKPNQKLIVACLRGGRSLRAAAELMAVGYTQIIDMRGGYDGEVDPLGNVVYPGWSRRGLPTTAGG